MTFIRKHQEVYGNNTEINELQIMMIGKFLIFLLIIVIVVSSNLEKIFAESLKSH